MVKWNWSVLAVALLAVVAGPAWAQSYTVTVYQATGGTVTVSPSQATYSLSSTATVTATVTNSSYTFAGWLIANGTISPSASQATLTVLGNVTLSAVFKTPTPLNLSSVFNSEAWLSPAFSNSMHLAWVAGSRSTTPDVIFASRYPAAPPYQIAAINMHTYDWPLVNAQYWDNNITGGNGVGGLPANGTIVSPADSRIYYLPSIVGNSMYSGDQVEISSLNALLVGTNGAISDTRSWGTGPVTLPLTPGNYSDINLLLAAPNGHAGAAYTQIWAVYADSPSALIYDFGPAYTATSGVIDWPGFVGPAFSPLDKGATPYSYPPFAPAYKLAKGLSTLAPLYGYGDGAITNSGVLYEFATPVTLNATKILTGIKILNTAVDGFYGNSGGFGEYAYLTIFAATATRLYTNACAGNEITVGGTITLTPSGPYFSVNQVVGIVATPNPGWQFVSWSAVDATLSSSTAATTSLTVLGNFDLTATFSMIPYTVTTSAAPLAGGTVSYSPTGTQYINNMIVLAATANPGWQFVGWTASGATLGATNVPTTTATVTNYVSLTASFAPIPYTVTVNQVSGGTVTVSPSRATYYYGNTATVTASVTGLNCSFAGWSVTGGTISPSVSQATLTVLGNVVLSANIDVAGTLTVTAGQGAVTVSPTQANYAGGTVVTISTSTVNAGYVLDHWNVSGASTLSNSAALTTSLTLNGNSTLTAVYVTGSYVNNLNPLASDSNPGSLARPFKTINKATSTAQAGTTIVVMQGVYREAPTLNYSGTPDQSITLKSNPGDRVVINGALTIPSGSGSWTPCTSATASGNPNFANIYYTDIPWLPTTLYEDEVQLNWPATPASSWWVPTATTTASITDSVNLTQSDANYWNGASVYVFFAATVQSWYPIASYNPATNTIAISGDFGGNTPIWYYIDNSLHLFSAPGQVVVQPTPNVSGSYRVFVWPVDGGRPDGHLFEGAYVNGSQGAIYLGNRGYWTFSGLELCNNQSGAIGSYISWGTIPTGFTIQNCVIHNNDGGGNGRWDGITNSTFLNNFITRNGNAHNNDANGLGLGPAANNSLIQGNEISFNARHGVDATSSSTSFLGNYFHDHNMWGHCDNTQMFSGNNTGTITNVLWKDNLMADTAFGAMVNPTVSNVVFQGNTYYFSAGQEIQGAFLSVVFDHNTMLASGYQVLAFGSSCAQLYNNLMEDNSGALWSLWPSETTMYASDYNLFHHTITNSTDGVLSWGYNSLPLSQWVATTSQDAHSLYGNPRFANMGSIFLAGAFGTNNDFAPNHFYCLDGVPSAVSVGDYICIDCDGVARQVTAVNTASNFITFTPSSAKVSYKYMGACDWGTNSNFAIDLTLQPGSAAIGAASDQTNIGSSVNVPSYEAGNFGVYGSRPTCWPYTPANVTQWAVVATHSGGDVAVTTSEGQVEPRSKAVKFQITFDSALNAATISISGITGVTIISSTGGNYSNRIYSATLDSAGKVLTVTLSSPLPDQQWYTIALNPLLTATVGGPVRGVKSVKVGMLAGNVTGSGRVTTADVAAERSYIGVPVTPATARYDIDGNGVITAADQRLIQSLVGHSLP